MALLAELKCTVCTGGELPLNQEEIIEHIRQFPEWSILEENGVRKISKTYRFKDFLSALDFTNQVAGLAEEEGHHPALITEWGKVTVLWWTHKIQELHKNDFIMAAKTDQLYSKE